MLADEVIELLAGPEREHLDRLTQRGAWLLDVPCALLTLAADDQEQLVLSAVGLPEPWASRSRLPTSAVLRQQVAYAEVPLTAPDGRAALGTFGALDTAPRTWSAQQLAILETLADAASGLLARLLGERQQALLIATLNHLDVGVLTCDSTGHPTLVNPVMRQIWGAAEAPTTPDGRAGGIELFQGDGQTRFPPLDNLLDRALAGRPLHGQELVLRAPGIEPRRFLATAEPISTETGRRLGAMIALSDITDRRRGEMLRAAQDAAARASGGGAAIDEVVRGILQTVCQVMGWSGGEYWQLDPADGLTTTRLTSWWSPLLTAPAEPAEPEGTTHPDHLTTAVWSGGAPIWLADLSTEDRFGELAAARQAGLNAAVGLANRSRTHPGVFLFFAERLAQPSGEVLIALDGICAYVGRFLERRESEELARHLDQARADLDRVINSVSDYFRTVEILPEGRIRVIYVSSDSQDVFGGQLPTGDDSRWTLAELIHPEDQLLYKTFHAEVLAGQSAELECRVIGLDGITRWVWTRAVRRSQDGRVLIDGISSNVTLRKLGEIALKAEQRRLRQAQSIGRIGSWEWDLESDVVTWSETMFELYGVDPTKFTAREVNRRCIHPDDVGGLAEAFWKCARTGEPLLHRYRVVRPIDGRVRTFETRGEAMYGAGVKALQVAGTAMDITEQVNAQREAAAQEAMLRAILANSQSLIYVKRLDGRYLMVNEPMLRARRATEAEMLGKTDVELDPVLGPTWAANDKRARQGEYAVEEWADGPDGRMYYDSVKFPLLDADGRVYATCGISLDVTARRRVAEAMAEARDAALAANAAKSSFLATMSHEIRTPMNAVIGMTDLLLDTALDPSQQEYVETVRTSGTALLAIINNILDFSRIEAGQIDLEDQPFDLRGCLEDSMSLVAGGAANLDLVIEISPACPEQVSGDLTRLRQVLVNLVGNAVKFTQRGEVLISVLPRQPNAADPAEIILAFTVRDTGIGIPADRMDRLFTSFSQVDASTTRVYGGTGLGLAISQAIAQAMAGDITVTSEVGVGSTFSFDLTFRRCDAPTAPTGFPDLVGRRVLIVDDNDTNRRILRLQLTGWGMVCTDLASGAEALAVIPDAGGFDLAILDLNMPDLDGVQLAERIRLLPAGDELPLILLTSLGSKPDTAAAGLFAGFHTKPIRAGALRTMVANVLASGLLSPSLPMTLEPSAAEPVATLRVLLAEDNPVNQRVAATMLRKLGHAVTIAGDGQQALRAIQNDDYDVVLMDIHMPTMDGLDATRAIRAQIPARRQPHIVALTASSLPEDQRACLQAGMNGYLLKPVRISELASTLKEITVQPISPATTPPVAEVAVDLAEFQQLTIEMGLDLPADHRELIDSYLDQASAWMRELEDVVRAGNRGQVREIAHTLRSSSALLGVRRLPRLLAEAEALAGSDAGPAPLRSVVDAATAEYQRVAMVFQGYLETLEVDGDPV